MEILSNEQLAVLDTMVRTVNTTVADATHQHATLIQARVRMDVAQDTDHLCVKKVSF